MALAIVILFAFAVYVGASIVRSIKGYTLPPLSDDEKYKTISERIQ
jgi:hypothetical protein